MGLAMKKIAHTAVLAAGFAAVSVALPAHAADLSPSLQSFATARAISAYELSAPGVAGGDVQTGVATTLTGSPFGLTPPSFASSALLGPNLALDSGRGLDLAGRFTGAAQPFLSAVNAPYLAMANGGRYSGVTFVPSENLRMRAGVSISSERLDRFTFDSSAPKGPLALTYDASQSKSLLGGISLDVSRTLGLDLEGIVNERSGVPLGFSNAAGIAPKSSTQALTAAARMDLGRGWVTTASFSEGMTQLDQRLSPATSLHEQSFSLAITKHGLFGDDALGLSFSRPPASLAGSIASLSAAGDLPLVVASGAAMRPGLRAPENDIQLGYITNFMDGAVALQTNAAYQTNFQGQPGATSVSLLSRAKIKF
jgi:hypothetical protein